MTSKRLGFIKLTVILSVCFTVLYCIYVSDRGVTQLLMSKAWYLVAIILLSVIDDFLCSWIQEIAYSSAGHTKESILNYAMTLRGSKNAGRFIKSRLLSLSPNPSFTKSILNTYLICTAPGKIFAMTAFMSFFADFLNAFLDPILICTVILSIFYFILWVKNRGTRKH